MKRITILLLLISTFSFGQNYKSFSYLGLRSHFGSLTNPYTNGSLADFNETIKYNVLEYGVEGMDKNFYVNFKTDFFGVIPDYIIKAFNKNNRKQIYGAYLENFNKEYNKIPQQYEFNACFSDWDVMALNIAYGYKYAFLGVNAAWSATTVDAYQSVSNLKIKKQEPANYYGFNERGNFSYGLNATFWNNSTEKPIRLICSYDWLLMRDYTEKWRSDFASRMTFDLQATYPIKKKDDKTKNIYLGLMFRKHTIDFPLNYNAKEYTKTFTSSITSIKIGYSW